MKFLLWDIHTVGGGGVIASKAKQSRSSALSLWIASLCSQ